MKQPEKICAIDRKEKQKNYVQEEREYQDSLEYLDFDIDILLGQNSIQQNYDEP